MIEQSDREVILDKLIEHFPGKIVRKDLTKHIKEGANVPVYVLEYLLGMYCSSQDEEVIEQGIQTVKEILAKNYVRPDEAQKIISKLFIQRRINKNSFVILITALDVLKSLAVKPWLNRAVRPVGKT